jgi:hypothetical protein
LGQVPRKDGGFQLHALHFTLLGGLGGAQHRRGGLEACRGRGS